MKEKSCYYWPKKKWKPSLASCHMSPKSLPDYLTIEVKSPLLFSYAYIPQTLPEALKEKAWKYIFGEDELDYASL